MVRTGAEAGAAVVLGPYLPTAVAAPRGCVGTGPGHPALCQPLPPTARGATHHSILCLGFLPVPPGLLPVITHLGHGS